MSKDDGPPYCIPYRRKLKKDERGVLEGIVRAWRPELLPDLAGLFVVARCGCGCCPSILFSDAPDGEPMTGPEVENSPRFEGVDRDGNRVAAQIWMREGRVSELRLGYIDGSVCDYGCPAADTLRPVREMAEALKAVEAELERLGYTMETLGQALSAGRYDEATPIMEAVDAVLAKHGASWHELRSPMEQMSH